MKIECGFATVEYIFKEKSPYGLQRKFYQIAEFGVDENFRRMGVAIKLISFCKQEDKNRGFDRLGLDVWKLNKGAMRFYDSVGFKTYREYKEMNI
nr:GNAT family N-acetyltransferase [uncultured Ruminococcus sp.]